MELDKGVELKLLTEEEGFVCLSDAFRISAIKTLFSFKWFSFISGLDIIGIPFERETYTDAWILASIIDYVPDITGEELKEAYCCVKAVWIYRNKRKEEEDNMLKRINLPKGEM